MTLIVPDSATPDSRFALVGYLTRTEADNLVVGYSFDLRTNNIKAEMIPNPSADTQHNFAAYRLKSQAQKPVTMLSRGSILRTVDAMEEE